MKASGRRNQPELRQVKCAQSGAREMMRGQAYV